MQNWILITPEYPPKLGGVSDYAKLVADGLISRGEKIYVIAPGDSESKAGLLGEVVERLPSGFGISGFWRAGKFVNSIPKPRRLFLQWVPHGYGFKSVNIFLVWWLIWRVLVRRDQLWMMAHEPFLSFAKSFRQRGAAAIHRIMVWTLLRLADRVFAGNQKWISAMRPWCPTTKEIEWLPVPSTLPVIDDREASLTLRRKIAGEGPLVGHFGTYGAHTAGVLEEPLRLLLEKDPNVRVLLLGKNGDQFRREFIQVNPSLTDRVFAPGTQTHHDLSLGIGACDLFLQAYTGGVSTRNTSIMAVLSHGKAAVGTSGPITDPEWADWKVVDLFPIGNWKEMAEKVLFLLNNPATREQKGKEGLELYERLFSGKRLVDRLMEK